MKEQQVQDGEKQAAKDALTGYLRDHGVDQYCLELLWRTVIAFQNYPFATCGRGIRPGIEFRYTVSVDVGRSGKRYQGTCVDGYGNELFIAGKGAFMGIYFLLQGDSMVKFPNRHYAQGYYYSKPVDFAAATEIIKNPPFEAIPEV